MHVYDQGERADRERAAREAERAAKRVAELRRRKVRRILRQYPALPNDLDRVLGDRR